MEGQKGGFGYFLARQLGDYVGETFAPDQASDKWRDGHGNLKKEFFAHCSSNALDWWRENRDRFGQDAESGPGAPPTETMKGSPP